MKQTYKGMSENATAAQLTPMAGVDISYTNISGSVDIAWLSAEEEGSLLEFWVPLEKEEDSLASRISIYYDSPNAPPPHFLWCWDVGEVMSLVLWHDIIILLRLVF